MRSFHFHNSRIVKTGLAVFLTAVICEWFHWPPVFAVITAIVTIEPTVSDSIKKGIVRFPASAIGSAFAVFFIALFGNSPITYTLAAVSTILVCYRLKLHAGLLVATLTAVAMVEVIHSNYLISFFIRLGTTTTGLLVSTAVNMLVFPPNYRKVIADSIRRISEQAGSVLKQTFRAILYDGTVDPHAENAVFEQLTKEIRKTETLIHFQHDESTLYPWKRGNTEELLMAERQLLFLHKLEYHLGTLRYMPVPKISWTKAERDRIMQAVTELENNLQHPKEYHSQKYRLQLKNITDLFWKDNEEIIRNNETHSTQFPPQLMILYELVTIFQAVVEFYDPGNAQLFNEAENKQ